MPKQRGRNNRLEGLFHGGQSPAPPNPSHSRVADGQNNTGKQTTGQQGQTPNPRSHHTQHAPRNDDVSTGSSEDEYTRDMRGAPSMKQQFSANPSDDSEEPVLDGIAARGNDRTRHLLNRSEVSSSPVTVSDSTRSVSFLPDNRAREGFCPLKLVTEFCYKFLDDPGDRVSKRFFAAGKIWSQKWTIYFIHPPVSPHTATKAILLVPESQAQKLVDDINSAFKVQLVLPADSIVFTFYHDVTPFPKLIGPSQHRNTVHKMERSIAAPTENHGICPSDASPERKADFERWQATVARAVEVQKQMAQLMKNPKDKAWILNRANALQILRRAQRYLGLRPVDCKGVWPVPDVSKLDWGQQLSFEREQQIKFGRILLPLDVTQPAPSAFEGDAILIAMDLEVWEKQHSIITEVGISTLDTAEIKNVAPGEDGCNWRQHIRSRHLRVKEHDHIRNTFCPGAPDQFRFGTSELVRADDLADVIDACFLPPNSTDSLHNSQDKTQELSDEFANLSTVPTTNPKSSQEVENGEWVVSDDLPMAQEAPMKKKIVLVGHELGSDLKFLSTVKSKVFYNNHANSQNPHARDVDSPAHKAISDQLDTGTLYKAWKEENQMPSVAKILAGLGIPAFQLHNAGNDARYTLDALVAMLVRSRIEQEERNVEEVQGKTDLAMEERIKVKQQAVERAERRAGESWQMAKAMVDGQDDLPLPTEVQKASE